VFKPVDCSTLVRKEHAPQSKEEFASAWGSGKEIWEETARMAGRRLPEYIGGYFIPSTIREVLANISPEEMAFGLGDGSGLLRSHMLKFRNSVQ
jgi:hypothetical protein